MIKEVFVSNRCFRGLTFLFLLGFLFFGANAQRKSVWNWQYLTKTNDDSVSFQVLKDGVIYLEESVTNKQMLTGIDAKTGLSKRKTELQIIGNEDYYRSAIEQIEFAKETIAVRTGNEKVFFINRLTGNLNRVEEARKDIEANFVQIRGDEENLLITGNETGFRRTGVTDGTESWTVKKCFDVEYSGNSTNRVILKNKTAVFTCDSGKLYAFDAQNGTEKWVANYGQNKIDNILHDDKNVYVLVENYQGNGLVQALNLETGKLVWEEKIEAGNLYNTSFLMNNGKLFVNPYHGSFKCFDAETGRLLWEIPKNNPEMRPTDANTVMIVSTKIDRIVFAQGKLFGTSDNGFLSALDENTGKLLWQTKVSDEYYFAQSKPLILGKTGYLDLGGSLSAFNIETGKPLWKLDSPLRLVGSDGATNLFFSVGGIMIGAINATEINRIARTTKKIPLPPRVVKLLNSIETGSGSGSGSGSGNGEGAAVEKVYSDFEIVGEKAYYTEALRRARKGTLYEINLQNGQRKKIVEGIEASGLTKPTVRGNFAYVGTDKAVFNERAYYSFDTDGAGTASSVLAINLDKSEIAWQFETNAAVTRELLSAEGKIFFYTQNGTVYALDEAGKLAWNYETTDKKPNRNGGMAFADGLLYVSMSETFRRAKTSLFALDAKTGEVRWKFQKDVPLLKPFVQDKRVFIGDTLSRLYFLAGQTGNEVRFVQLHRNPENIRFQDNLIFVHDKGYSGWLSCLERETGKLLWERNAEVTNGDSFSPKEIKLFNFGWHINSQTGEKIKRLEFPKNMQILQSTEKMLLTAENNSLKGIDAESGKVLWSIPR